MPDHRRTRPEVVLFDVVQTIASLEPLRARLTAVGVDGGLLERWFAELVRDGMALTLAGGYTPFRAVAGSALRRLAPLEQAEADEVLDGFATLPLHPDAAPAIERLRSAGVRVAALTNGSSEVTRQVLERGGVLGLVEAVLSIDAVQAWKPAPAVYALALRELGVPAERAALVAVHAWDLHGGAAAGLTTGWCSRLEQRPSAALAEPHVSGADLVAVADALLSLPG